MRAVVWLGVLGLAAMAACATAPPPAPARDAAAELTELELAECRAGRDDLCLYLAEEWPYAQGAQRDRMEAGLTIACERGNAKGCRMLGQMLARTSSTASVQALNRACQLGALTECHQQVLTHGLRQRPDTYDPRRAMTAAEDGCRHGDPELCGWVLRLNASGELEPSAERVDQALVQLHCGGRAATDPICRRQLGLAYAGELSVPKEVIDPARARAIFGEACDAGDPAACHLQARLLYRGEGGPVDRPRAVERLEQSCAAGVVQACFLRARVALVRGRGYSSTKAVQWFERACGDQRACLYEAGLRLAYKAEWRSAERLLERSCQAGEDRACGALGRVLVLTRRRADEALDLLDRACTQQDQAACLAAAHLSARPGRHRDRARAARYRAMAVQPEPARRRWAPP